MHIVTQPSKRPHALHCIPCTCSFVLHTVQQWNTEASRPNILLWTNLRNMEAEGATHPPHAWVQGTWLSERVQGTVASRQLGKSYSSGRCTFTDLAFGIQHNFDRIEFDWSEGCMVWQQRREREIAKYRLPPYAICNMVATYMQYYAYTLWSLAIGPTISDASSIVNFWKNFTIFNTKTVIERFVILHYNVLYQNSII